MLRPVPEAIALLDWDNSLRQGWILVDWTAKLAETALLPETTLDQVRGVMDRYKDGGLSYGDFALAIPGLVAQGLRGASIEKVAASALEFVRDDPVGVRGFARPLLQALRDRSIASIVVSGAPQEILDACAACYGLDAVYGTTFGERLGHYSGEVMVNRAIASEKTIVVDQLVRDGHRVVMALGDSEADLPLLTAAELPIIVGDGMLAADIPNGMSFDPAESDIASILQKLDRA